MIIHKVPFDRVSAFTPRDIKYQIDHSFFQSFYQFSPDIEGLKNALKHRSSYPVDRNVLYDEINRQYQSYTPSISQKQNIEALKEKDTYTVITAHQPSLFTGPLYYIYKIFSTINLADRLSKESGNKIIPVLINGSEDHDFEEVNHFNIYGKKIEWQNPQGGPVGRYDLEGISDIITQLSDIVGNNQYGQEMTSMIIQCHSKADDYNGFVFQLINALFNQWGLLVVNMDNVAFKRKFAPIMKDELLHGTSAGYIRETQSALEQLGLSAQAFARDINLFYMQKGMRERLILEDGIYKVNQTTITFTQEALLQELENHPERFSPNVVMRPMYEETIMPNVAYIGGGGELAYWLERKAQFDHYKIFFPCLIRRNSVLIINKNQAQTIEKMNLSVEDLFLQEDRLIDIYLDRHTEITLNITVESEYVEKAFNLLRSKAGAADKTLEAFVDGEKTKSLKQLEAIESRIKRSLKKNEETALGQLKNIKTKLFPNNGLQERNDNVLQYLTVWGEDFMKVLHDHLDPLDKNFIILVEN